MRLASLLLVAALVVWVGLLFLLDRALAGWLLPDAGEVTMEVGPGDAGVEERGRGRGKGARAGSRGATLGMPVAGIEAHQLRNNYGDPRGQGRLHQGIDILAPRHTPVLAADDGVVARMFDNPRGGLVIYQTDPSGRYCYYYAHLEGYAPRMAEGRRVRRGQILGYVGTSGNAPPNVPHLHFAVSELPPGATCFEGVPLDPFPLLGGG
jgi:peptidoglycan LD-endopeptidase LytH